VGVLLLFGMVVSFPANYTQEGWEWRAGTNQL
jgi:hypothetical protein